MRHATKRGNACIKTLSQMIGATRIWALQAIATTWAYLILLGAALPGFALADQTYQFDIPAQDLGSALKALGAAANEQILFSEDVVSGHRSTEVKGEYGTDAALSILLKGTGLQAGRTPSCV